MARHQQKRIGVALTNEKELEACKIITKCAKNLFKGAV